MKNIYYVINTSDLNKVDFVEIVQKPDTLRYSLDGSKFFIKTPLGVESEPSFISNGNVVPVNKITTSEELDALITGVEWNGVIE